MHVILIVDHDDSTANFCRREFERAGDRVLLADDGLKALTLLRQCHIDLMILDTDAPLVDELNVVTWALIHFDDLHIVIHTSDRCRLLEFSKWPVEACVWKSQYLTGLMHAVGSVFARR